MMIQLSKGEKGKINVLVDWGMNGNHPYSTIQEANHQANIIRERNGLPTKTIDEENIT